MKVLLIVVDGAAPRVFCPAVKTGRLRTMQRLAEAGCMHEASVSIFPSITPAATSSIITGCYPSEHGIEGAAWFQATSGEIAYYGDDLWVIGREGVGAFIDDFLLRLNGDHLRAPTLFELVERAGRQAASLNYLVYRGLHPHRLRVPRVLAMLPGVQRTHLVNGPSQLYLGTLADAPPGRRRKRQPAGGPLHRFGMDDAGTGVLLDALFESGPLPDFTVAYFPDNDFQSHARGPAAAVDALDRVDMMLGGAFERAGGLDRVLRETAIVITSDHGHCEVLDDESRAVVPLDELLKDVVRIGRLGAPWQAEDDVMICPNMRAAQIYFRDQARTHLGGVVTRLLEIPGVDQVMWRLDGPAAHAAYVVMSHAGRLEFAREASGARTLRDPFGGTWCWRGDAAVLDLVVDDRGVSYRDYPNAFERIAGALDSEHSGDLWVTAKPGAEFQVPGGAAHVGGSSHGSLHALDSLSPMIVAGPQHGLSLPEHLRSIDIAPLCLELLGLPMRYTIGDPRPGR
jgi:predicted AlkP superfamily pyrophosphatase or phosphodiesterase